LLDKNYTTSIIHTKLNQPPLPVDMVARPHLTEWLDRRRERPLTLVSAPAGYGKSTLISSWLESVEYPTAWLSLDKGDNDLGIFLGYFLAAVRTKFPMALLETQALLMVIPLPPISAIVKILINELNQIEEPFILVLDDYHLIETQAIHDFLKEFLLHPPGGLHLVLGTRMDPSLPLANMRAKSQVTEIRIQDLRFSKDETQQLFQKMMGHPIDGAAVNELNTKSEGWVTGLRLAALAMRHHINQESFSSEITAQNQYVTEYLITEILAKQAVGLSDCMLKISILERFCADLCEAVCFQGAEFNGVQFLEWLQASSLFIIPIDDQNKWFRFHHLFRYTLQQELVRRYSPEEIEELHAAAGCWFTNNNWVEEALHHLLEAGDTAAAVELVAQHRSRMMNSDQWARLERWMKMFSAEAIHNSAELWMLKTWLIYHRGLWAELPEFLEVLATIMAQDPEPETGALLAGEISTLRSLIAYHAGFIEEAITQARRALEKTPFEFLVVRILARSYLGLGLLLSGDESGGYHVFYDAFAEEKVLNNPFRATLLMTACYFHWINADLLSMTQSARQSIIISQETGYRPIQAYGKYNLGRIYYQQNDLDAAEEMFAGIVAQPYQNYGDCYTNSVCGLAITYQAQGREAKAREVVEAATAFLLETGNMTQ
jgi:LuxR family maltose regulon positive regulatory protein